MNLSAQPEIIISKQGRQLLTTSRILRRMDFEGFKPENFIGAKDKIAFTKWDDEDTYRENGYQFRGASGVRQIRRMLFEPVDGGKPRGDAILIGSDFAREAEMIAANGRPSAELLSELGIYREVTFDPAVYNGVAGTKNGLKKVLDTRLSTCRLAPLSKNQTLFWNEFAKGDYKVLTMFPELVKLWLEVNGLDGIEIEFLDKGIDTEAAKYPNVVGIDIVDSGKTARENGLCVLDQDNSFPAVLPNVSLGLYAPNCEDQIPNPVKYFSAQVERALNGMNQVSLIFNLPSSVGFEDTVAAVISDKLGWSKEKVKRATVSPLANGGQAVEIWVPRESVKPNPEGNLLDALEVTGATGVGVTKLDLMGD